MVIGVADFAVGLAGSINSCIPVYSWVYPEERDKGFYDYAQALDIMPYFIKKVGPYGYNKLANVQSKTTFGGLENANTIFYHENSITGNRKSEALMAHEIAHQWFGNMATEKTFAHLWLSEGFATFMTIAYMESRYGRDTALAMRKEDREQVIDFAKKEESAVVNETTDYMKLLNTNSYQKGGWVLHMLQAQLGDSIFWKCVRNYYATYAGKNADTRDLQTVFENTSGKDLSVFFNQWLYTPGVPKLAVEWKYLSNERKLLVTVTQLQKNTFSFPLDIEIKTAKGNSMRTITVARNEQRFSIPVNGTVSGIVVDPHTTLLFEATENGPKRQR
jgi:aminopeptidase N